MAVVDGATLFPLLLAWVEDLKAMESGSKIRVAVLDIQGDWPAFLQVFGLRYWSHNDHPCPLCRINQTQLGEDSLNENNPEFSALSRLHH